MALVSIQEDIAAQLKASEAAAVWENASDLGVIEVRGADQEKWLNGLVTCDVTKLTTGVVSYGLVVGRTGKMQADVRIVRAGGRLLLVVPMDVREQLLETFERHLIMEDVELSASPLAPWLGTGPKTELMATQLGAQSGTQSATWDRTGFGGALAFVDPAVAAPAIEALSAPASMALRLRHGIAKWGVDFDATLYPHEASLEKVAVAFDKGCYLGQEVVCMVELRGQVKRKLVLLQAEGPMAVGDRVFSTENADIGEVRSAAVTPDGSRAIALVKVAFTAADTVVRVGSDESNRGSVLKLCGRA